MEAFEDICRICLQSDTESNFTDIFSNNRDIALNLSLISGVKFEASTGYSALICQTCLKELYKCIFFRRKCQSADEYFRNLQIATTLNVDLQQTEENSDFKVETIEIELAKSKEEEFTLNDDQSEEIIASNEVEEEYYFNDELTDLDDEISVEQPVITKSRTKKKGSSQCRYCGIVLSRRNRRIEHERLHQQRLQLLEDTRQFYTCFLCGKQLNQKCGLVPHFQKVHGFKSGPKERWKCAICDDKFLPPGNMALHYEKVHFKVSLNKTASRLTEPNVKKVLRESEKSKCNSRSRRTQKEKVAANFWPCSICGNSFSNFSRYQKHLKEIHGVNENQVYENFGAINHLEVVEKKDESPKFPCTTCGKVFASIMTVRAHEKTHLNIEYLCDLCGSKFRVKAYLTAHVQKVHMKLKKFKCSIENCSASFVHRELLNYHVRKHLNIRNFSCRYCSKTFVTRSCCKIHERIHTDDRPYACKFCNRTFIHHSDHRRHEQKHMKEIFATSI